MGENRRGSGTDRDDHRKRTEVAFWAALATLAIVATAVTILASRFSEFPGDLLILEAVQSLRSVLLDDVMLAITYVGYQPQVLLITGTTSIVLWAIGLRKAALFAWLTLLGDVLSYWLKTVVARPRPPIELVYSASMRNDFGFPSGHALHATLFYGFLAFVVWQHVRHPLWRWGGVIILVGFALLTGLSRVYLGAHWPSDVLGGFLIGLVLLFGLIKAYTSTPELPGGVDSPGGRGPQPPEDRAG